MRYFEKAYNRVYGKYGSPRVSFLIEGQDCWDFRVVRRVDELMEELGYAINAESSFEASNKEDSYR